MRLINHTTMDAKLAKDGQSQIRPLLPGPNGVAIVKLGTETIATLVQNKKLAIRQIAGGRHQLSSWELNIPSVEKTWRSRSCGQKTQLQDLPPQGSDPYALAEHHTTKEENLARIREMRAWKMRTCQR